MSKPGMGRTVDLDEVVLVSKENVPVRDRIAPEIITAIKEGDHDAYTLLYDTLYNFLVQKTKMIITSEEDARDIVQDVFGDIWEGRSMLDQITNIEGYLRIVAKRKGIGVIRQQQQHKNYWTQVSSDDFAESPDEVLIFKENNERMNELLQSMPEKRRKVYELSRFENKTYEEIGQELNISPGTVHKHIKLALETIRRISKEIKLFTFFGSL